MAGGYGSTKGGPEGLAARIMGLQRQIDQLRLSAGVKSAIIRGDVMRFQVEDSDQDVVLIGNLTAFSGAPRRGLDVLDDNGYYLVHAVSRLDAGTELVQFGSEISPGVYSLENFNVNAQDIDIDSGGPVTIDAGTNIELSAPSGQVDVDAGTVDIDSTGGNANFNATGGDVNIGATGNVDIDPAGELQFFIGSHAVPANLSKSGNVVRSVSSAAKYKADIEDIVVDRDALLAMSGKTYVDAGEKAAAAENGGTAPARYPGFIADEWAAHESTRQFVQFGEDGEPESFFYDRVSVAHHEVLKDHEHRLSTLEDESATLKEQLAAIENRLARLEGTK